MRKDAGKKHAAAKKPLPTVLAVRMFAVGITAQKLARKLRVPVARIYHILRGNAATTEDGPVARYFKLKRDLLAVRCSHVNALYPNPQSATPAKDATHA